MKSFKEFVSESDDFEERFNTRYGHVKSEYARNQLRAAMKKEPKPKPVDNSLRGPGINQSNYDRSANFGKNKWKGPYS